MKKVIKRFSKFSAEQQEMIYDLYADGNLERTSFPYQGEISLGVIYEGEDDELYLIPVSSITADKLSSSQDEDEEDNNDDSDMDNMEEDTETEVDIDEE